uniref:Uncharacterized protein n=1 Tax=Manihot esculenta TaxID=3983 RepID=A0A2C9WNH7_MANES
MFLRSGSTMRMIRKRSAVKSLAAIIPFFDVNICLALSLDNTKLEELHCGSTQLRVADLRFR